MTTIRTLQKEDQKQLESLFVQLTGVQSPVNINELLTDDACNCIIIEENDAVTGFGSLITYRIPSKGEVGRIEDVIVDSAHRGKGLGRSLVEKLIQIGEEKNLSGIYLTSNPKRVEARALYESLGFVQKDTTVYYLSL